MWRADAGRYLCSGARRADSWRWDESLRLMACGLRDDGGNQRGRGNGALRRTRAGDRSALTVISLALDEVHAKPTPGPTPRAGASVRPELSPTSWAQASLLEGSSARTRLTIGIAAKHACGGRHRVSGFSSRAAKPATWLARLGAAGHVLECLRGGADVGVPEPVGDRGAPACVSRCVTENPQGLAQVPLGVVVLSL